VIPLVKVHVASADPQKDAASQAEPAEPSESVEQSNFVAHVMGAQTFIFAHEKSIQPSSFDQA
jgi:hypothetical protein